MISSLNGDNYGAGALAYGDGTLFAMTGTATYRLNPVTGTATILNNDIEGDDFGAGAVAYVPLPSAMWMFVAGCSGLVFYRKTLNPRLRGDRVR